MDIVLTTYATVAADFRRGKSMLNRIFWYRLVLDEGNSTLSFVDLMVIAYMLSPLHPESFTKAVSSNSDHTCAYPLVSDGNANSELFGRPRCAYEVLTGIGNRRLGIVSEAH